MSCQVMRQLEAAAVASGVSEPQLMQAAAEGIAKTLLRYFPSAKRFAVFCGKGKNGGDGRVCARLLREAGKEAVVFAAGELQGEGELPPPMELRQLPRGTVCVDALVGVGFRPPLSERYAALSREFLQNCREYPVVAIDVPSGLEADRGIAQEGTVRAGLTVTCGLPKVGLLQEAAQEYVGRVEVAPLPLPEQAVAQAEAVGQWLCAQEARALLPVVSPVQHKRRAGRVHVVAGSEGMLGAAVLTTRAAVVAGAGLVTLWAPPEACAQLACSVPEALVRPRVVLPDPLFAEADAVVLGPGWGVSTENLLWLLAVLERCQCPVVLDADAITLLANRQDWHQLLKPWHVLTPHGGEWSRLLGRSFVPREEAAEVLVQKSEAVFLLKGPSTLVATRGLGWSWNSTGNAALATAGSGDVLAGICGALLAKKLAPFDAARLGAFVHGYAADLAVGLPGEQRRALFLTASDVLEHVQAAMARLEQDGTE